MDDQLAGAFDAAGSAQAGMLRQPSRILRQQHIECQWGARIVKCDVGTDLLPIGACRLRPNQPYGLLAPNFARVAARQAAASASTSSAGMTSPMLAASMPVCT